MSLIARNLPAKMKSQPNSNTLGSYDILPLYDLTYSSSSSSDNSLRTRRKFDCD